LFTYNTHNETFGGQSAAKVKMQQMTVKMQQLMYHSLPFHELASAAND